jgi:hypothetical protein
MRQIDGTSRTGDVSIATRVHHSLCKVVKALLAGAAGCAIGLVGGGVFATSPALALDPGRACVFYYPFERGVVGHTAWAFSVPGSNQWIYGSADGDQGGNYAHEFDTAPITSGVWVMRTDNGFNDVLSTFRARAYTAYTCKSTPTSAVGGAQNKAFADRDWSLFGNNCGNHANDILTTYFGGTFKSQFFADGDPDPVDWFNGLPGPEGQGFDGIQPLFAPDGFKGGTVKDDNLDMRDAGMAGPVTWNSPVVRHAALGTQLVIVCWMNGPSVTGSFGNGDTIYTYSTTVWDAVVDTNATTLNDGTPRLAVSDAWMDTGGDTSKLIRKC